MVPSGANAATSLSAPRRRRALPPSPAPGPPAHARAHAGTPDPLRRGRRRHPDGFDQRARARALSHGVEPLRPLRPRAARPPRLPSAPVAGILGPRCLPRADLDAAVVEAGDARLPPAPHRLVGLAA